ncbi:MAG TPA: AAA family ATPase [Candidatus Omnitrophota bacterium]|nr:AAA family ATPase [Candidatus Omnitrophota bacterium]HQO57415.1 AAA family ATPase [Candidatus Omnitrophota bacterium]
MKKMKNIFISSIYQNAGKTTVSLGLYRTFQERKLKTTFMKPVGQQTVNFSGQTVDKDSYLIGEVYRCQEKIKWMSPVTVGRGFTEKYIFNPQPDTLRQKIEQCFLSLTKGKDAIIIEGTGHAGVGAVIDLSNAEVASMLHSKVIIVSEGGIGRSIDEIMLNKALFDAKQVPVLGVIVNKVLPQKYDRVQKALQEGLKNKGLLLLGLIPQDPILSSPTVGQLMKELNLQLLCGHTSLNRKVKNTIIAAMEPYNMINYITDGTMVITSGDRVDNILAAVSSHLVSQGKKTQVSAIMLTGGLTPNVKIVDLLEKSHIPILITEDDTYKVAGKIENLICKIQKTDKDKIAEARQLVKKHVDVDAIINNI